MKSDKILVFIPAYNCEKQLPRVLAQLDHVIMSYITDVIIVNNCSIDGTVEAAKNYLCSHPEIPCKILNNNENYNLGGSHKVAFQYAIKNGFDYVAMTRRIFMTSSRFCGHMPTGRRTVYSALGL